MNSLSQKVFVDNLKLLSSNFMLKCFTILFLIIYARILSPFELSILPIFSIISGISTIVFNFGFFSTLIRQIPIILENDRKQAIAMLNTSSIIISVGVILSCSLTFLLSGEIARIFFKDAKFAYIIKLMSGGVLLNGFNEILSYYMRSTSQFGSLALKEIISGLGQQVLGICLYLIWGIKGLVMGINFGLAITFLVSLYLLRNYVFEKFRLCRIKKLIKFSYPYYIESYLHYFRNQGDQIVIGAYLNPAFLSTYYIARRLFDNLNIPLEILNQTITPALSKATSFGKDKIEKYFTKINCLLSYLFIPLSLLGASLSYAFVNLVGGEKYSNATIPSIIFCFTILICSFHLTISRFIFVLCKPNEMLKFTAIRSLSILLFLILLIRPLGITGAALSHLIAVSAALIFGYFTLRRLIKVNFQTNAIINILLVSIIMALIISVAQILYFKLSLIPLYISIGILVSFSIFVKTVRKDDLELIQSTLPLKLKGLTNILYKLWPTLNLDSRN